LGGARTERGLALFGLSLSLSLSSFSSSSPLLLPLSLCLDLPQTPILHSELNVVEPEPLAIADLLPNARPHSLTTKRKAKARERERRRRRCAPSFFAPAPRRAQACVQGARATLREFPTVWPF
jgi:hypothetical protein